MSRIQQVLRSLRRFPYVLVTEHYPHTVRSCNRNIVQGFSARVESFLAGFLDRFPCNAKSLERLFEVQAFVPNSKGKVEVTMNSGYLQPTAYRYEVDMRPLYLSH